MARLLDRLLPAKSERRHDVQTIDDYILYGGHFYPLAPGVQSTMPGIPIPTVGHSFPAYAEQVLKQSAPVYALESFRLRVFSSVRFLWQRMREGRPQDMFGTRDLRVLERPWAGGTTQNLLEVALMYRDLAGNAYCVVRDREVVFLRPDWMRVVFQRREDRLGWSIFGYVYYPDGDVSGKPEPLSPREVAHFMAEPDPQAPWRGMSWLTPVIREFQLDMQSTQYMQEFYRNAASPNLAVSLKENIPPKAFDEFVDKMEEQHTGVRNTGRTLYLGGGADVTVVGADLSKLAIRDVQGGFETRLASAAGVHPVMVGFREGMQGSSLNAGNYTAARRSTADGTFHPLWQDAAGSLEVLLPQPGGARLWYDARGVPFLREDAKDEAEIQAKQVQAITSAVKDGFTPESAVAAIIANDMSLLRHTGLVSVQLQKPGTGDPDLSEGDE